MSEATISEAELADETNEGPSALPDPAVLRELGAKLDRANMKKIGAFHFAMVMGALTLWGAAEAWAQTTGWALAHAAAVANAVIAGTVLASTLHEWGHFTGARMSGAISPVLDEPRNHFFMFDFKMDQNDVHQFTWMSWGGILTPWVLVGLTALLVPLSLTSGAALFSTLVAKAVAASAFEVPIVRTAGETGNPSKALGDGLPGLESAGKLGNAIGLGVFVLLWIAT